MSNARENVNLVSAVDLASATFRLTEIWLSL